MTLHKNCSWNGSQLWSPQLVLVLGIPQITLNILSLVSNGVVIIVILASHDLHHPIFILFGNLALSDLLSSSSGLWISVLFLAHPDNTIRGSRDLLVPYALYATSILSTIYNLVSIGMERYLMVVGGGLRAPARVSKRKAMTVVLANWALAVALGSLPLLSWNGLDSGCQPSELYGPFCIDYLIFITIPHCVVALALPLFSYLNIVLVLRKQEAAMESHGGGGSRSAEVPVVRTSIAIWLLTLASYAPFFAGVLVDVTDCHCPEDLYPGFFVFRNVTAIMITLNALGNPVLYTLKVKSLGSKFLPLFSRCSPTNQIQMEDIRDVRDI